MKKILFIAPFSILRYKGGITKIAEILGQKNSEELFKQKDIKLEFFNSHYLIQSPNSDAKFRWENLKQAFSFYSRLKKRIKTDDFALIHINSSYGLPMLKDLIIINILKFKSSKPILFQIHFSGIEETFSSITLVRKVQFQLLKRLNLILLLSKSFKNEMVSVGFQRKKLNVLHNFHPVIDEIEKKNIEIGQKMQLLFMGSIDNRKGILDLLESLKGINIKYELDVAGSFGSDEIEINCKRIIENNNLNVNFHGYVSGEEKEKLLKQAHILILPSYAEGFPMVIPEAMAYGCAILATKIAGIPEIVIEDANGILFKPGDINSLRAGLEFLYNNVEVLKLFMNNSIVFSKKFSLHSYIDNISKIYNKAI